MANPFSQPYSVQLDPDTARRLATNGATVLLLDVPECTPIGIDQQVFLTGPNFKGVKMMPPGVHFLSFQARGRDGTLSPPVSTFLQLQPQQVFVRRWDAASEGLVELDEDEAGRYAAGAAKFDFDRGLAPYDLNRYSQWVTLSGHITAGVLKQLLPPDGEISVMSEAVDPGLMNPNSEAEKRLQQHLEEGRARMQAAMQTDTQGEQQPQLQAAADAGQQAAATSSTSSGSKLPSRGGRCRYSQLPRVVKVAGAPAAQLTALNIDKTSLLEQVIARYSSSSNQQQQEAQGQPSAGAQPAEMQVAGELQFAFIAFVFGQSLEGYMQWKQLLVLLLGCVSGPLDTHTALFVAFLSALTAQLQLGLGMGSLGGSSGSRLGADAAPTEPEAGASELGAALLGAGFVEELLPDSFLKQAFRGFFEMLQESSAEAPAALLAQARMLEAVLAAGLGWDFRLSELHLGSDSQSDDEYGPVVVELTEQQLAELQAAGQ